MSGRPALAEPGRLDIPGAHPVAALIAVWLAVSVFVAVIPSVGADAQDEPYEDELVHRGGGIYQANCAACHGTAALGGAGRGVERGPPLDDISLLYVDQTLRTGRMPIAEKRLGVLTDRLDDDEREALLEFMRVRFGLEGDIPTVGTGVAARGQELYVRNCAACHGAHTTGGIVGGGTEAPPISVDDPVAVAEAIRVGPREMPAFEAEVLDQQQVDDVIAYLTEVDASPRTLLGLREINDVVAAVAAIALTGAVLALVRQLGRRDLAGEDRRPTAPGGGTWT